MRSSLIQTRSIVVDPERPDPAAIKEAATILEAGGLVAFPTETVYGLGADATSAGAVGRIFQAKGRPPSNPLIVHVDGADMARSCLADPNVSPEVARLWDRWWPGPVTFVLEKSSRIPDVVTAGSRTVGLRMPRSPIALALIQALGRPIAAPSANRSTGVSPTRAEHVRKDLDGLVELILDGGPTSIGLESTVVDLTGQIPRVLRVGPITESELRTRDEPTPGRSTAIAERPASPGQARVHYAPRTPTYWVEPADLGRVALRGRGGLLVVGRRMGSVAWSHDRRIDLEEPVEAARRLYDVLHDLEDSRLDFLVVVPPPAEPEWETIRDRLWRASRPLEGTGSIEEATLIEE
ncbi:MAG: L-threonylcarbamoyladenylate synthase [Isosphaeraceae bacterium]